MNLNINLDLTQWVVVAAIAVALIGAVFIIRALFKPALRTFPLEVFPENFDYGEDSAEEAPAAEEINDEREFNVRLFEGVSTELYRVAFATEEFVDEVPAEQREIAKEVRKGFSEAVRNKQYLPRKPLVIPQLLKAVRSDDSTKKDLVEIIVQDPVLAGDVLKTANSPYYRLSKESIETVGEAVVILGIDGLRSVVSTSVMQPVFQVPKNYYPQFSETIWEMAVDSALAAQVFARKTRSCDSFTAHLLGLLSCIGQILMFRVTVDNYDQKKDKNPNLSPMPEVFVKVLSDHAVKASRAISHDWELGDHVKTALDEFVARRPLNKMSSLGQSLYYGTLCGTLSVLVRHFRIEERQALIYLKHEGLNDNTAEAMWKTVTESE